MSSHDLPDTNDRSDESTGEGSGEGSGDGSIIRYLLTPYFPGHSELSSLTKDVTIPYDPELRKFPERDFDDGVKDTLYSVFEALLEPFPGWDLPDERSNLYELLDRLYRSDQPTHEYVRFRVNGKKAGWTSASQAFAQLDTKRHGIKMIVAFPPDFVKWVWKVADARAFSSSLDDESLKKYAACFSPSMRQLFRVYKSLCSSPIKEDRDLVVPFGSFTKAYAMFPDAIGSFSDLPVSIYHAARVEIPSASGNSQPSDPPEGETGPVDPTRNMITIAPDRARERPADHDPRTVSINTTREYSALHESEDTTVSNEQPPDPLASPSTPTITQETDDVRHNVTSTSTSATDAGLTDVHVTTATATAAATETDQAQTDRSTSSYATVARRGVHVSTETATSTIRDESSSYPEVQEFANKVKTLMSTPTSADSIGDDASTFRDASGRPDPPSPIQIRLTGSDGEISSIHGERSTRLSNSPSDKIPPPVETVREDSASASSAEAVEDPRSSTIGSGQREEASSTKSKREVLEARRAALQDELQRQTSLLDQYRKLESAHERLSFDHDDLLTRLHILETENRAFPREIEDLQRRLENERTLHDRALLGALKSQSYVQSSLTEATRRHKEQIKELTRQHGERLEETIRQSNERIATLTNELKDLHAEHDVTTESLRKLRVEHAEVLDETAKLIHEAKTQAAADTATIERLRAELAAAQAATHDNPPGSDDSRNKPSPSVTSWNRHKSSPDQSRTSLGEGIPPQGSSPFGSPSLRIARGPPSSPPSPPGAPDPGSPHSEPPAIVDPPFNQGMDWREHRIDPSHVDHSIDGSTGTIRPWIFLRPETGSTVNHGVRFKIYIITKDAYLRQIDQYLLATDQYPMKDFMYNFPRLRDNAHHSDKFDWYNDVVRYCAGAGIYIPMPQHVRGDRINGLWFDLSLRGRPGELPAHVYDNYEKNDALLKQVLIGKQANLGHTDSLKHLTSEHSGYQILRMVLRDAGHPHLTYGVVASSLPRQTTDMSFMEYRKEWIYYMHLHMIRGVFFSDRFFIETFLTNMHAVFNTTLKTHVLALSRNATLNQPFPPQYYPENFDTHMCESALAIGIDYISSGTTPRMFREKQSGRPQASPSSNVRALDIRMIDDVPEDLVYCVAQLMANNPRSCDFCGSDSHLVATCPTIASVATDPRKAGRISRALTIAVESRGGRVPVTQSGTPPQRPRSDSNGRPRTPRTGNGNRAVRAIAVEDTSDDELTVAQVDTHEATDDEDDDGQDFQ